MKTRLILVRHGESEYNLKRLCQGQVDSHLTPRGKKQAHSAAERLKDLNIDAIYASPLQRAAITAEIVKGKREIKIRFDDRLKEINLGQWEGLAIDKIKDVDPIGLDQWENAPHTVRVAGAETLQQVYDRVSQALADIINQNQGKTVLIAAHMIAIMVMLVFLSGDSLDNVWNLGKQPNSAITIIEINSLGQAEFLVKGDNSHLHESDIEVPDWEPPEKTIPAACPA